MRTDKRNLQEEHFSDKKLSPRTRDKQPFMGRQQQYLQPLREPFKKPIRPSLLIQQQQPRQGPSLSPESKPLPGEQSPRKASQLKESVSTNSTIREMGAKARSCREPTMQARGCRKEDFILGASLGKGKFGCVYVARHKKTGFICALKVINKSRILKQNILHQLIREIKIQSYCDHPSLTKLYGYFSTLDQIYLITQLSSQGQLLHLIQRHKLQHKPISQPSISYILRQICQGVRYMHTLKIIHRDLKPQNILMERGTVRICDFGWAVYHTNSLRTTFCGTPLYVSPEILKGESYDEKVDLWAVGILAWEMMYGDIPFDINNQQELIKIVTEEIVFPETPKVSSEFKDFISKILKKNPKERLRVGMLLEHPFLQPQA